MIDFSLIELGPKTVDLSPPTIQRLFQQQIRRLTAETIMTQEDTFDIQFSGGWVR